MEPAQMPIKRSRQDPSRPLASSWTAANNSGVAMSAHLVDKGIVSRWVRDDLEDKYLSLYQDHSKLKERFRDQEEKIQECKLVLKKKQDQIRQQQAKSGAGAAELRATDQVVKLEMRNVELEKQCAHMQQRLTLLQSQLESPAPKRGGANTRILQPPGSGLKQQRSLGRQEDAKAVRLQMANAQLMTEIEGLKDKLYGQAMEHQQRVQNLHSELETSRLQSGTDKRVTMQDDLDKVKLQRELREKSAMLEHLQARCETHEDRERQTAESNSRQSGEIERLTRELRRRDQETESLKESSAAGQSSRRRIMELEHALEDASKEAKLLKEANDKLMGSAFDVERERQWQAREGAMTAQIKQLEATMHRDVGEKGDVLDRLESERNRGEGVEKELSTLRIKCYELREQNESLQQKIGFFTQESAGDMNEMEEALLVVKQRRQQGEQQTAQLDFLHRVDTAATSKDSQWRLREVEAAHADTIQELEKTRQLLESQYHINQDMKSNHGLTERQLDEIRSDRDAKMAECAKLLDIRAARIRKLEKQLRDVAYGTRQFTLAPVEGDEAADESDAAQIRLQNGENLVEIHIGRLSLTDEGSKLLGSEPALFCTWAFYACEMQTSDVMHGDSPDFDKTVQYVIKVDDAFLHYVNKDKVKLELFQSHGMEYRSQAACRISVRELLESQPAAPVHGRATLLTETGDPLGVLDYWLRMRVPMQQAMRLYRERAKALGYMTANQQAAAEGLRALDESAEHRRPAGGAHSLDVKLVRCRDLRARRQDMQPSPYCSYKLFDCEDAISPAIPNSCEPEFHFHQRLHLAPGPALDRYLRTQQLVIWVLDEADSDQSAYLGVAKVDLVTLSQNKPLHGTYQLLGTDNQPSGTVDLEIFWQFPYMPAGSWDGKSEPIPLLSGEAEQIDGSGSSAAVYNRAGVCDNAPQSQSPTHPVTQRRGDTAEQQQRRRQQPQQSQQPQSPEPSKKRQAAGNSRTSSRAGSIAEDACVESFDGIDENVYRQHKQQLRSKRVNSSKVVKDLNKVLTAPPDRILLEDSEDTADAESVASLVPEPVKIEQRKPSLADEEKKLQYFHASQFESNEIPATVSLEPPGLQEKLRKEQQRQPEMKQKDNDEEHEEEFESEHESDDVVVETGTDKPALDSCTVQVFQVHLDENCEQLRNPKLNDTRCFVSFQLPGYSLEDTETPLALPTPRPGKSRPKDFELTFNFQKIFDYSFENQYQKRHELAVSLLQDSVQLPFSLVCESTDENNEFFTDLGHAMAPMSHLVATGQEIKESTFPLMSPNGQQFGSIKLSTNLPCLLHQVLQEMPEDKKAGIKFAK